MYLLLKLSRVVFGLEVCDIEIHQSTLVRALSNTYYFGVLLRVKTIFMAKAKNNIFAKKTFSCNSLYNTLYMTYELIIINLTYYLET